MLAAGNRLLKALQGRLHALRLFFQARSLLLHRCQRAFRPLSVLLGGGQSGLLLRMFGRERAPALADLPQPAFDLGALLLAPRQVASQVVLLAL